MQHLKLIFVFLMNSKKRRFSERHRELIEQCRKGNRKAQFKLYKLYYKAMYNTSLRIVNNRFEAEDVMQEAFLKAFTMIDRFKGEVSFGAWLKKIVINQSLDSLKKKKIKEEPLKLNDNEPIFETDEEDTLNSEIKLREIKNEIQNLPEGYRIVLSLYLLEGYDHNEISQILGISASASRSQYSRAKNKLLSNLKKNSYGKY